MEHAVAVRIADAASVENPERRLSAAASVSPAATHDARKTGYWPWCTRKRHSRHAVFPIDVLQPPTQSRCNVSLRSLQFAALTGLFLVALCSSMVYEMRPASGRRDATTRAAATSVPALDPNEPSRSFSVISLSLAGAIDGAHQDTLVALGDQSAPDVVIARDASSVDQLDAIHSALPRHARIGYSEPIGDECNTKGTVFYNHVGWHALQHGTQRIGKRRHPRRAERCLHWARFQRRRGGKVKTQNTPLVAETFARSNETVLIAFASLHLEDSPESVDAIDAVLDALHQIELRTLPLEAVVIAGDLCDPASACHQFAIARLFDPFPLLHKRLDAPSLAANMRSTGEVGTPEVQKRSTGDCVLANDRARPVMAVQRFASSADDLRTSVSVRVEYELLTRERVTVGNDSVLT